MKHTYEITFYLSYRLPSCQHTFSTSAESPQHALTLMLGHHPMAMMPFTISEMIRQGEGHKELR